MAGMNEVTQILVQIEHGDPHAAADLLPLVYAELRRLAAAQLTREITLLCGPLDPPGCRSPGHGRSADRIWAYARAWLRDALTRSQA